MLSEISLISFETGLISRETGSVLHETALISHEKSPVSLETGLILWKKLLFWVTRVTASISQTSDTIRCHGKGTEHCPHRPKCRPI